MWQVILLTIFRWSWYRESKLYQCYIVGSMWETQACSGPKSNSGQRSEPLQWAKGNRHSLFRLWASTVFAYVLECEMSFRQGCWGLVYTCGAIREADVSRVRRKALEGSGSLWMSHCALGEDTHRQSQGSYFVLGASSYILLTPATRSFHGPNYLQTHNTASSHTSIPGVNILLLVHPQALPGRLQSISETAQ